MEQTGVAIDLEYLSTFSEEITTRLREVESEIYQLAGQTFNVNSTRQLATILFEELKLPSGKRTKTGYSVDQQVLENLRTEHPLVELILEYRTLGKLLSTYVDALPSSILPTTGRVHTGPLAVAVFGAGTPIERSRGRLGGAGVPADLLGSHSSHDGSHQFRSPRSVMVVGRRTARTTVASRSTANARPTPSCFIET